MGQVIQRFMLRKKNMFRVKRHDSNGLVLGNSYAGTVRVYIDEQLIFSLVPPREDGGVIAGM